MTTIYNLEILKNRRKELRNYLPPPEILVWDYLKKRKILGYKFRRQYSVGNFIVDFYCPALKLAIEIDGDSHEKNYDLFRQKYIEKFGIRFLRFSNDDVYNDVGIVIEKIREYMLTPS